jgi:YVTN family beta-propeller protein
MKALLGPAVCLCLLAGTAYPQYVEDSIQVPGAWVGSLVYNSREDVVYGASEDGYVFAIGCSDNRIIASLEVKWALGLAYDSTDNKAWCSYYGREQESLAVIDGATHATMPVWDRVTDRVYVSCQTTNRVAVLDGKTDSLLCYIPVGACPIKMCINTMRRKLYTLNYDAGSVSVVDLGTNQVIKTVATGGIPEAGHYSAKQDKMYVSGAWDVAVLDGASDSVIARIPLQMNARAYAEAEAHDLLMVGAGGVGGGAPDTVFIVDVRTNVLVAGRPVGRDPWCLVWSPATDLVYCANSSSNSVTVLTGDGSLIAATLAASSAPFTLLPVLRHRRVYVGHLNSRWVYVIGDSVLGIEETKSSMDVRVRPVEVRPNPFSRATTISWFELGMSAARVYGTDGSLIRELPPRETRNGSRRTTWDGQDVDGRNSPPGVYCVRLASETAVVARLVKVR